MPGVLGKRAGHVFRCDGAGGGIGVLNNNVEEKPRLSVRGVGCGVGVGQGVKTGADLHIECPNDTVGWAFDVRRNDDTATDTRDSGLIHFNGTFLEIIDERRADAAQLIKNSFGKIV